MNFFTQCVKHINTKERPMKTLKMFEIGKKPAGIAGKIAGILMNSLHNRLYIQLLQRKQVDPGQRLLDAGCGGGMFIKMLNARYPESEICGIDHSQTMLALAKKTNRKGLYRSKVRILNAQISKLPFENDHFDVVTAFDTIQFWPLEQALAQVCRVLKHGGIFVIINRYPDINSGWYERMQIKDTGEYRRNLERAGFSEIETDIELKKGWIFVRGRLKRTVKRYNKPNG